MPIDYSVVQPAVLTGYVRNLPVPPEMFLSNVLPNKVVSDIEAAFDRVTRTNTAARYRSFDAETPIGKRDQFNRSRVVIPPLGQKTVIGEFERLQLERMRNGGPAGAFGGGGGASPFLTQIYDDVDLNARAVQIRAEFARGDVLSDGKLTLTGDGMPNVAVDYGLPSANQLAVSTAWSNHATADPYADLQAMANLAHDNGVAGDVVFILSRDDVQDALACASVRSLATTIGLVPAQLSLPELNKILAAKGLGSIIQYNARFDVAGTTTRVMPQHLAVCLPANPGELGYTAWGITAEALELIDAQAIAYQDAPGLVAYVDREDDPPARWTKVTGTCLPVITAPEKLVTRATA